MTEYDLKVTGTIPPELKDGRLLRTGPNPIGPQDPVTYNWFTGNGLVHGVRIRDGKAEWYRSRFVRDDEVARSRGLDPLPGPQQLGGGAQYVADNIVRGQVQLRRDAERLVDRAPAPRTNRLPRQLDPRYRT